MCKLRWDITYLSWISLLSSGTTGLRLSRRSHLLLSTYLHFSTLRCSFSSETNRKVWTENDPWSCDSCLIKVSGCENIPQKLVQSEISNELPSSLCRYKYISENLKKGQEEAFNLCALIHADGRDLQCSSLSCEASLTVMEHPDLRGQPPASGDVKEHGAGCEAWRNCEEKAPEHRQVMKQLQTKVILWSLCNLSLSLLGLFMSICESSLSLCHSFVALWLCCISSLSLSGQFMHLFLSFYALVSLKIAGFVLQMQDCDTK